MSDMKCEECVLKHLSTALSFGKEIMSGHDENNELDHRIDFLGEISNAEQHLELINKELFNDLSFFRKSIQEKDIKVDHNDLIFIREIFRKVELIKNNENIKTKMTMFEDNLDIVYIDVKDINNFDLSYKLLKSNLTNYGKVYVINSNLDFSKYDVEKINCDIYEFMKMDNITENVVVMNENMSFCNSFDLRRIIPTYLHNLESIKQMNEEVPLPKKEVKKYGFENIKPQPINVKKWNEVIDRKYNHPISVFFNLVDGDYVNDTFVSVEVNKPICCSVKQSLKIKKFVRWDERGFESLKQFKEL